MRKFLLIVFLSGCVISVTSGQKFYTKNGHVHFLSEAPIETIQSNNNNAYVVLDGATGQFEFSVLIKGFNFEKALMQQHFNENYLESDKFPKSVAKGSVLNWSAIRLDSDHEYNVNVSGQLTIHGITKPFSTQGKLVIKDGMISIFSTYTIVIADYGIEIPKVVRDNISKTVKVTISADLQPMK